MTGQCHDCKWWSRLNAESGICRFNPPTPALAGHNQQGPVVLSLCPQTASNYSCARYQKKLILEVVDGHVAPPKI